MRLEQTRLRAAIKREAEKSKWPKNVGGVGRTAELAAMTPLLLQGRRQLAMSQASSPGDGRTGQGDGKTPVGHSPPEKRQNQLESPPMGSPLWSLHPAPPLPDSQLPAKEGKRGMV